MKKILIFAFLGLYIVSSSSSTLSAITLKDMQDYLNGHPFFSSDENSLTCEPGQTSSSSGKKKLYVLGDSLISGSLELVKLEIENAGFEVVKINADGGRAIKTDTAPPGNSGIDAIIEDGNLDDRADGVNIIGSADAVVISLGTNSRNEDLNIEIPRLVAKVREAKPNIPIFWVNLFYTAITNGTAEERNAVIADQASKLGGIRIIDAYSAGIELGEDKTHPNLDGSTQFAKTIADDLKANESFIFNGDVPEDGINSHVLSYPGITDENAAAKAIDDYIQEKNPESPFLGLGKYFIIGGKRSNVNPFLAAGHLKVENGFVSSLGQGWHNNSYSTSDGAMNQIQSLKIDTFNAFGASSRSGQPFAYYKSKRYVNGVWDGTYYARTVYKWPSWVASLDYLQDSGSGTEDWFQRIRTTYLNPGSKYESTTFEKYLSHYAPNSDGNDGDSYKDRLFEAIDAMTANLNITAGGLGGGCDYTSNPATGDASKYISDCGANDGNAAIACTAINQLMGIPYDQNLRAGATEANPKYLDCSALTGMALYRTFGVDLGGICSTAYLTNANFERIEDIRDIRPGDFIGKGTGCATGGGGGHIALVVSYNKETKELVTVEASSKKYPSGIRGGPDGTYPVSLAVDGLGGSYIWAVRYIGNKTLQPGATK